MKHAVHAIAFASGLFVWGMLLVTGSTSYASGVTFYASMDGAYDGKGQGIGTGTPERGSPQFVPGKRGQAILTGSQLGHLIYSTAENLPAGAGTIEFWVCPEDWDGMTDEQFHEWFVAQGDQGWLQVYKYYQQSRLLFFLTGSSPSAWTVIGMMIHEWKSGQWHHLVCTWSPLESAFYVDGKLEASTNEFRYPQALPDRFSFGDHTGKGHSRVDELYIYDRPLTREEVAWAYEHALDRPAGQDVPETLVKKRIRAQVKPSPARGMALVQALVLGSGLPEGLRGEVRITAGKHLINAPLDITSGRYLEKAVDVRSLPGGEHPVQVILKGPAGEFARVESTLSWAGNPPWRKSGFGLKPLVSVGYKPITIEKNHIQCSGRDYLIGSSGLLQQITSAGNELLEKPVSIEIVSTGGPEQLVPMHRDNCTVKRVNEATATIKASSAISAVTCRVEGEAYFDGLFKYTIALAPKGSVTLNKLILHIPLKSKVAQFFHYPFRDPSFGVLPVKEGILISDAFGPFIWLGNNECGLMFMCESDEPFRNANPKDVYRFVRTGNEVEMQVALIDTPLKLPPEWKLTFGLQASPIRPLEQGWRKWTIATGKSPRVGTLWPHPELLKYYGYPEAGSKPEKLKEAVRNAHEKGMLLIPYINPSMLSGGSPEWKQFGQDWRLPGVMDAMCPDVTVFGAPIFGVSSSAPDWQDVLTWKTAKFLKEYDLDGLYYDHTLPFSCDNELLGEGYTRDGVRHPTYNIFSKRELYRRLYNVVKAMKKDTFIFAHTGDVMPLPYLAFCDGYVAGEGLGRRVKDNYLDIEQIDYYRSQFVGYQWGCKPYWLDEISGDYAKSAKAFRHWTGLCLLLDCGFWPVVGYPDEANAIIEALKPYGWEEATFIPYWKNQEIIAGQTDSVKVSTYQSNKGVLLAVLNLTRDPQEVTLRIAAEHLKLPSAFSAKDLRTGEAVNTIGGTLNLSLEGMGLRLIFLRKNQ